MADNDLGLYLNSINTTKKNVMRGIEVDPAIITKYPGYVINKLLSYHQDCVLIVNELNKLPHLDNQLQYEFLLHMLPKKSRYSKLHRETNPDHLELVKRYYGCNTQRALELLHLHTEDDFSMMSTYMCEGGVIHGDKNKTRKRNTD